MVMPSKSPINMVAQLAQEVFNDSNWKYKWWLKQLNMAEKKPIKISSFALSFLSRLSNFSNRFVMQMAT